MTRIRDCLAKLSEGGVEIIQASTAREEVFKLLHCQRSEALNIRRNMRKKTQITYPVKREGKCVAMPIKHKYDEAHQR